MTRGVLELLRRDLRETPVAPAGFVVLGVVLYWSARDGGSPAIDWAGCGLLLVGLLAVVATCAPGTMPGGRAGFAALLLFAGFVVWSYLSIAWAQIEADAWSGANKTLVYFCVYAVFAVRPWQARMAGAWLGAFVLGITAIGLWELVSIATAADPNYAFREGRFAEPISYANANCALYLAAVAPAVFLASSRVVPLVLRGVFFACAGALLELGFLCQSRMSLLAVPVVAVCYLVLIPGRLRSLLALASVAVVVAVASTTLLDVYETILAGRDARDAVDAALTAVLVSMAVLLVAGVAWALLDRRVHVPERVVRSLGIAAAAAGVLLVLAGAFAFGDRYGNPADRASIWWDRFRANEYVSDPGTPHLISGFGGAGRYDIWRVALDLFEEHPVAGIGVDNFAVDFLQERRVQNSPLYPHSFELRLLQQTGIVGTALMVAFLVLTVVAGWSGLRRGPPAARGIAASALLVFAYWLVHGSIDWLWEVPALSGAAFAGLGLLVAVTPVAAAAAPAGEPVDATPVEPSRFAEARRWAIPVVAVGLAAFAVVTLGAQWLAARETDAALTSWRVDPQGAYDHLDRARSLDRFSDQPDVLAAVIAAQRGEVDRQRSLLGRALERNPYNWYPYVELGLIEARAGNQAEGLRLLRHAKALNPLEETIGYALRRVQEGEPPSQAEIDAEIVRTADFITGVRQTTHATQPSG